MLRFWELSHSYGGSYSLTLDSSCKILKAKVLLKRVRWKHRALFFYPLFKYCCTKVRNRSFTYEKICYYCHVFPITHGKRPNKSISSSSTHRASLARKNYRKVSFRSASARYFH